MRVWGLVAAGLIGLLCATFAIRQVLPDRLDLYAELRSEVLQTFERYEQNADIAAFGSSHISCAFDPLEFDRMFREPQDTSVAVNMAIAGGAQTEQRLMAKRFLDRRGPACSASHPCLAMLELNAGLNFPHKDALHPRAINIYDFDTLGFVIGFGEKVGIRRETGRIGTAMFLGALNVLNVGMLAPAFMGGLARNPSLQDQMDGSRGLYCGDQVTRLAESVDAAFAKAPHSPAEIQAPPLPPGLLRMVQDLKLGHPPGSVEVDLIVSPALADLKLVKSYPDHVTIDGIEVPILSFADPRRYPALYDPLLWRDPAHLTPEGAKIFSDLLACRIRTLRGQDAASMCGVLANAL